MYSTFCTFCSNVTSSLLSDTGSTTNYPTLQTSTSLPPPAAETSVDSLITVRFYVTSICIPVLCVLGIIGNILNIIVLTRRRMHIAMDCTIEKAAHLGLIVLAGSDFIYCVCTLHDVIFVKHQAFFYSKNFRYYLKIYGPYVRNSFSQFSTWLTVILAVGRFAAICYPLQARHLVRVKPTVVAIIFVFTSWFLLNLPRLWEHSVYSMTCPAQPDEVVFILDRGPFATHSYWRLCFVCIWFTIGFLLPVCMLAYCNIRLIGALRESYRVRRAYHATVNAHLQIGRHITPTLIAIVVMYIILVSPSEIINFLHYLFAAAHIEAVRLAIAVTNALHTLNFAVNFILYLIVNIYFRNTLREMLNCLNLRSKPHEQATVTTQMRRARFVAYSSVSTKSSKDSTVSITAPMSHRVRCLSSNV